MNRIDEIKFQKILSILKIPFILSKILLSFLFVLIRG